MNMNAWMWNDMNRELLVYNFQIVFLKHKDWVLDLMTFLFQN